MRPPAELPLAEQIGLDVLAAELARDPGPTRLVSPDELRTSAALARLELVSDEPAAAKVLWIATGTGLGEAALWTAVPRSGRLALLTPGPLSGVFDRLRRRRSVRRPIPRPPAGVPRFETELALGIGGPSCMFWAALVVAATRAERLDLADRFELRYRRALAPRTSTKACELVATVLRRIA